jgi:hypothetical protein
LLESLHLKRFNTIGCKMKIYQERLREINFIELLLAFRDENAEAQDFELKDLAGQRNEEQKALLK